MIYTVTINPCIDYIVKIDNFNINEVNRPYEEIIYPGGKGINVSIMLKNLGIKSKALGFTAGFTGKEIRRFLDEKDCESDFIEIKDGFSRINVKLKAKEEIEINGQGPKIDENSINALFEKIDELKKGDYLVLAGSIPNTLPDDIYEQILKHINGKGVEVIVDATKDLLLNVLKYSPFLIKPNNFELSEIFEKPMKTEDDIIHYSKILQEKGAKNVLISRAADGAILIDEFGNIHKSKAPKGKVVNSVGAGDSMVAGFISGYINSNSYAEAFKLGIASGSASAFCDYLAEREDIAKVLNQLN